MGIFGLLFIILPLILLFIVLGIGVTLIRNILHLFGIGRFSRSKEDYGNSTTNQRYKQTTSDHSASAKSSSRNTKVIGDDEGEYVEFEEVK